MLTGEGQLEIIQNRRWGFAELMGGAKVPPSTWYFHFWLRGGTRERLKSVHPLRGQKKRRDEPGLIRKREERAGGKENSPSDLGQGVNGRPLFK